MMLQLTTAPDLLDLIDSRRTRSRLVEPGPTPSELELMLQTAVTAPDHGRLRPWRFVVFTGEDRARFGEVLAEVMEAREPGTPPERLDVERRRLMRAPMVVAVLARITDASMPAEEQVAAVSAATQNLLLAATALGYGSIWRTGALSTDPGVKAAFGLGEDDRIVGFVYLGTATDMPLAERPAHPLDGYVTTWSAQS